MTKAEFASELADVAEITNAEALKAVNAFIQIVEDQLAAGNDVMFAGFGKFSVSDRAARTGVNPQDPTKKVQIPARRVPRFTPGTTLKEKVAAPKKTKKAAKKK
jgi:DNA-binding protein HU-beta